LQELINKALEKESIELSSNKVEKLSEFGNKLEWWNKTHNITGARSKEAIIENIIDALIPISFVSEPKSLLDVGTGAGFPGLVLAIIWDSAKTVLAEPLNKRASFLRYISTHLELSNVEVFKDRVERLQYSPFEIITSRAVTDTALLLKLTKTVSDNSTKFLFYKGSRVYKEIEEINGYKEKIIQRGLRNYLLLEKIDG
jgi:16S rRNA (guanine527-N7)-methyltransferase